MYMLGTGICAYVTPPVSLDVSDLEVIAALKNACRSGIGAIAIPDMIVLTPGLPKTRSGKVSSLYR